MHDISLNLASPPDREKLVVQMMIGDEQFAEVSQESDLLQIEVYGRQDGPPWVFHFDSLMSQLADAQITLADSCDTNHRTAVTKTDEQSFRDIELLLNLYPGVTSAHVSGKENDQVEIRFRCHSFESLKELTEHAQAANLCIGVGCPCRQFCYEDQASDDMWFFIDVADDCWEGSPPSTSQIFGIFLARGLEWRDLLSASRSHELHARWNAAHKTTTG